MAWLPLDTAPVNVPLLFRAVGRHSATGKKYVPFVATLDIYREFVLADGRFIPNNMVVMWQEIMIDIPVRATEDVAVLVEFFNGEGAEYGREGDWANWHPAQTAVETMQNLTERLAASEKRVAELEALGSKGKVSWYIQGYNDHSGGKVSQFK